jgi:hypothetical protein
VKKVIPAVMMLLLLLIPDLGAASYFIRLKNGRRVATPAYWFEGTRIFFYTTGGIAGMERSEIAGVESDEAENRLNTVIVNKGKEEKALPPASPPMEKLQESTQQYKISEEKIDLKKHIGEKDRMMVELDALIEELRAATNRKDNDAKDKIREEIRVKSGQIYQLTDEVKKKNQGKLPEGWWEK